MLGIEIEMTFPTLVEPEKLRETGKEDQRLPWGLLVKVTAGQRLRCFESLSEVEMQAWN